MLINFQPWTSRLAHRHTKEIAKALTVIESIENGLAATVEADRRRDFIQKLRSEADPGWEDVIANRGIH
uniref:Uncharacterized protein n=1 Tax=Caenorhabditis japonica TaxID=281687 RepID=A0A8R1HM17_CAEJA